ncbi:CBS domain-containing protein [Aquibacillus rhizosphaerae]|uniref:CBS domain-containing protein n=1 Tax=Aquibacillus rhizosphaerae TaxID=3051431 RepID=A0ABT7L169_9BACI|nr:CBS domain-containing protein [Aquibacillus sp. LR5S19]MDL4839580.1 CBS domain-containing protein [Aquibacillus sp. LR5S19]
MLKDKETSVYRFEIAFNRIHKKLTDLVKQSSDYISYGDVLHLARNSHNVVRTNYDTLKQFGRLRNALVHQKIREDFYIAEPHLEVVEEIERLCELIHKPPLALSIASQPVTVFTPGTPLEVILRTIKEYGYSQLPIYENSHFRGLLTVGGIAKWMSNQLSNSQIMVANIKARDILLYEKKHNVEFLSRQSSIYDLETVFEESFEKNMKLEAILITQTGSRDQKPIGIVTSWDLVQIDRTSLTIASHV